MSYDLNGRMISATDPLGNVASYGDDAPGNWTSTTNHWARSGRPCLTMRGGWLSVSVDPVGNARVLVSLRVI